MQIVTRLLHFRLLTYICNSRRAKPGSPKLAARTKHRSLKLAAKTKKKMRPGAPAGGDAWLLSGAAWRALCIFLR